MWLIILPNLVKIVQGHLGQMTTNPKSVCLTPLAAHFDSKMQNICCHSRPTRSNQANCILSERAWWACSFDTKSIAGNHCDTKTHEMHWFASFQPKFSPKHMKCGCDVVNFTWYWMKVLSNDNTWLAGMVDQDSIEMQEKTCNFWLFWVCVDWKSGSCPLD